MMSELPNWVWLFLLLAVLLIPMFSRMVGYKKAREENVNFQNSLKPGDRIILSNGIHGEIVKLGENTAVVEISSNCNVLVERFSISMLEKEL